VLPDATATLMSDDRCSAAAVVGAHRDRRDRGHVGAIGLRDLLQVGLSMDGFQVRSAPDGVAGLELIRITGELERFAAGDFRERELKTRDCGEIGALTVAFNAAARQVAQSFAERARVEDEMRRFVADASHELRTPLTVVTGFVDVLRRGGYADESVRDNAFRRIAAETKRMRQLVERLIVLARSGCRRWHRRSSISARSRAKRSRRAPARECRFR
jgi:signal transduction histidine kinase